MSKNPFHSYLPISGSVPRRLVVGFSLVELMVAITLGLIILLVLTLIFAKSSDARKEAERANQQIENGRYAMQILSDDIKLAGYYGDYDPTPLTVPALPGICETDVTTLRSLLRLHIQGLDEISADQSCGTKILNVASGTDLLVVRRTSTCKAGPTADPDCDTSAPYLQATSCEAVLLSTVATDLYKLDSTPGNLTLTKRDCVTVADYRGFRTHVYYVSPNDQSGDGIPTLKVANLSGGDYSVTPLVEGIEQLQIEYGIDTSGDGLPDSFTSSPASAADWSNVVAVRIYVLARSADKSPGYVDPKTYVMGPKSYTPADKSYKRHLYQTEIRLNNPVGRRSS